MSATDRAAFLRAIADNPDDDLPRLVYADWLDEHGEPERAEFIRVQCELARLPQDDPRRNDAIERQQQLLLKYDEAWFPTRVRSLVQLSIERGFIAAVVAESYGEFAGVVDELFAENPVHRVTIENLRSSGLRALAGLPYLAFVSDLDASGGGIGNAGVEAFARSPHLGRLTRLDLGRNSVGDVGAQRLSDCASLAQLRVLGLSDCRLGDTAAEVLAASTYLTGLERLDLRGNPIGRDGAALLRARFGDAVKL